MLLDLDATRPRIRRLHDEIASAIPCDPEEVRADLRAMNLNELLRRHVNWADRLLAPRPRSVATWEGFVRHGVAAAHWDAVQALAAKIRAGSDLKPNLSARIDRYGYVRPETIPQGKPHGIEWDDKDCVLNAYDVHHLHLSPKRTRELLYVSFSRQGAFLVMVGDHNSFDDGTLARALAEARVGTSMELKGILAPARAFTDRERNRLPKSTSRSWIGCAKPLRPCARPWPRFGAICPARAVAVGPRPPMAPPSTSPTPRLR
jgi:hypothetical protein